MIIENKKITVKRAIFAMFLLLFYLLAEGGFYGLIKGSEHGFPWQTFLTSIGKLIKYCAIIFLIRMVYEKRKIKILKS
jgi:hypothetical protein